jgi:hypothetical protein
MARRYFDKFPTINYDGYNVVDVTRSAMLVSKYASLPYVYTPYTVTGAQRPDTVAEAQYDDPFMDWLIFYSNRIVDPYYGWHLSEDDLNGFLETKYGSVANTYRTIVGFRVNWYNDDRRLTPSQFSAMFGDYADPHSYYWEPAYDDETGRLLYYVRARRDNRISTNRITRFEANGVGFSSGDQVLFYSSNVPVGNGEVVVANSTHVTVRHVLGNAGGGMDVVLYSDPTVNSSVLTFANDFSPFSNVWTVTNISDEEYVYWEPYTVHDVEVEGNISRSNVKLIDPSVAVKVADSLAEELEP